MPLPSLVAIVGPRWQSPRVASEAAGGPRSGARSSVAQSLALALPLAIALLAAHAAWTWSLHPGIHQVRRGELPGFDSYVYVAMAERPAIFTLPPWGYRLLTPALVHVLPMRTALGFRVVALVSLIATAACLALFLRRLGHGLGGQALGVALFALCPFDGVFLQDPFLVDPLAVAFLAALLLAVESGAGLATLALLALLGTAAKEVVLVVTPFVCWARRDQTGTARALRDAVIVTLPAAAFEAVLRLRWPAAAALPAPRFDAEMGWALTAFTASTTAHWLLFGGIAPIALAGALHPSTRPYLRRYGSALVVLYFLPLAYTPLYPPLLLHLRAELQRYGFFALPLLIPVAIGALAWRPSATPLRPPPQGVARGLDPRLAWALTSTLIALPAILLDPYRRGGVHGRDGPRILALTRQSPRAADALRRGQAVTLDLDAEPFLTAFASRSAEAARWALLAGWETRRGTETGETWMPGTTATVVVPVLASQPVRVVLTLSAPAEVGLRADVGGRRLGAARVGLEPSEAAFSVPAAALARGENVLALTADPPGGLRLHRLTLEPASEAQR